MKFLGNTGINMEEVILRPHHLLCNYCFKGMGYSDEYVAHFTNLHDKLDHDNTVSITVKSGVDDICSRCPHNMGTKCDEAQKVADIDALHKEALELTEGQSITWRDAVTRITTSIDPDTFKNICNKCEWFESGICYNHLFGNRDESHPKI